MLILIARPRHSWEDNIKSYLGKIVSVGVDWINLAQVKNRWAAPVNTAN
jgi:hypothetical protein